MGALIVRMPVCCRCNLQVESEAQAPHPVIFEQIDGQLIHSLALRTQGAAGELRSLKQWWDELERIGPDFGYFANASKSWLIVKEENMSDATNIFANTGIQITKEGRRSLEAALGTHSYTEEFVSKQVQKWTEEVKRLATIAESQPHAANAALTHGLIGR